MEVGVNRMFEGSEGMDETDRIAVSQVDPIGREKGCTWADSRWCWNEDVDQTSCDLVGRGLA